MKRKSTRPIETDAFDVVRRLGLELPRVESATRYDGAPVLKMGGCFMAGLATHPSAEPDTLVVRMSLDDRDLLIADAPETYYVTDAYRPYPVVLVRLAAVDDEVLRELLTISWRLTAPKARRQASQPRRRSGASVDAASTSATAMPIPPARTSNASTKSGSTRDSAPTRPRRRTAIGHG